MRETMVLLPWWPFSAEVFSSLPFYKSALAVFDERFEVTVVDLPWIISESARGVTPRTLDDVAKSFVPYVAAETHLVGIGGSGIWAMLATSRQTPQLKSFVFDSFPVPPGTLTALGLSGLADMAAVALHVEPPVLRQLAPMAMPGGSAGDISELIARVRPTIDWDHCGAAFRLAQEVNLLEREIVLPRRTLFLDNPVAFPGLLDRRMAKKLFPNVEVQTREASDVLDSDKGTRFAEQVSDYVTGRSR